jgi:DNA-binding protein H-NS
MARPKSLAQMSLEALIELRESVTSAISDQANSLRAQLAALTGESNTAGKRGGPNSRGSALKGRRAAVKYRDKHGNKWSGRGAQPRWMTAAIKAGAKRDDFLVGKPGRPAKAKAKAKAKAPKKRATKKAKKTAAKPAAVQAA